MRLIYVSLATLMVSALCSNSSVRAAPPPAVATAFLTINSSAEPIQFNSSALNTTLNYSLNGASATAVSSASTVSLYSSASSMAKLDGGIDSGAVNTLAYFYDVTGATTTEPVPIDISFSIGAARMLPAPETGDAPASSAEIGFYQNTFHGMIVNDEIRANAGGGYPNPSSDSVTGVFHTDFIAGESSGEVFLATQAASFGYPHFSSSSSAFADPYIYIDPSYVALNPGVVLEISEGVGNSPSAGGVPESAMWVLLVSGFGNVGVVLRRRRDRRSMGIHVAG